MKNLLTEDQLFDRIFSHIDNGTTDMGTETLQVPVENYSSQERFDAEIKLLRSTPVPYCPSAMLDKTGRYLARVAANTPLIAVRDADGHVRAFINACRHRGMQVATGEGCVRAFVCPYHAWAYGLDGALINVPDEHGFPDLDKALHGLKEVSAIERGGLVYIQQEGAIDESFLDHTPEFFSDQQVYFGYTSFDDNTNWKLINETTMEGYHIKGLHKSTFYPFGYDNLNVVETFGPHSRIVFPFKRINELRNVAPEERDIVRSVTAVYNLFPNTVVSVLSKHTSLTVFEPIAPNKSKILIYRVANQKKDGSMFSLEEAQKDAEFVTQTGLDEDRDAAIKIAETLGTQANTHLTFGLFESAIVHFHQTLSQSLSR